MITRYYIEIIETLADSYELPENIRLRVTDKADAISKAQDFQTMFIDKPTYRVLFHTHKHSENPDENQSCIYEDIKKDAEK